MIKGQKILIFGGTGSLGNKLIERYIDNNILHIFSRDENKHWFIQNQYQYNKNLIFHIGDIRDYNRVEEVINLVSPDIIIEAAALKHIDRCEYEVNEALLTNYIGLSNVLKSSKNIKKLQCVIFISTDKACMPLNTYGITKSLSEKLIIEYSNKYSDIKYVNVRYGNVLNSRGSIIEILNLLGKNHDINEYKLTDNNMTRFIISLNECVNIIEYGIIKCISGDTIIPKITSMKISDLIEIFSEKYNKGIKITGMRPGEKLEEYLISDDEIKRLEEFQEYYIIKPYYKNYETTLKLNFSNYNSSLSDIIISKDELKKLLISYNYL